jgi:hypothetical protein
MGLLNLPRAAGGAAGAKMYGEWGYIPVEGNDG